MTDAATNDDPIEARLTALESAVAQLQMVFSDPRVSRRFGGPTTFFGQAVQADQNAQIVKLQAQLAEFQVAETERLKKQVTELEEKVKKAPADEDSREIQT